jgi:hypothetical protein
MSKIVKVSQSNYRLQVQSGGSITLDTGTAVGTVVITGNLDVKGTTTTVESTNTTVKDNILQLNYGQTGNGISSTLNYQAGIQVGRGNYSDAMMVFDETVQHYNQATTSNVGGTFAFKLATGALNGIQVGSISANSSTNINLDLQNTANVVTVVNADPVSYSLRVYAGDGNVIPNKQFVTDFVQAGVVVVGQADVDRIYKGHGTSPVIIDAEIIANPTNLQFLVRSAGTLNQRAIITASGLSVDDINTFGHTITGSGLNNLVLTSTLTNEVEINAVLDLDDQISVVTATSGKTKIYSSAFAGPGKSGLFFANNTTSDELVAKNRALLFSMIF